MIAGVSLVAWHCIGRGCHCHTHLYSQHMCDSEENISLICVYPRKELMSETDSQTLAQVGLSPSGVVIARLGKVWTRNAARSIQHERAAMAVLVAVVASM